MADYNIQIMRYNGDSYDNLYPETKLLVLFKYLKLFMLELVLKMMQ